jgi:hypothetical protein
VVEGFTVREQARVFAEWWRRVLPQTQRRPRQAA